MHPPVRQKACIRDYQGKKEHIGFKTRPDKGKKAENSDLE
jgi:hypothetical protein